MMANGSRAQAQTYTGIDSASDLSTQAQGDIRWAILSFIYRDPLTLLYQDYVIGRHRLMFATDQYQRAFRQLLQGLRLNICPAVIHAVTDRLHVTGFQAQSGAGARESDAQAAWSLWEESRLDRHSSQVHDLSLTDGDAYIMVWPDETGAPAFYPQSGTDMTVRYDPERPTVVIVAAKLWWSVDRFRLNLYYPDRIEKYQGRAQISQTATATYLAVRTAYNQSLAARLAFQLMPVSPEAFEPLAVDGEPWPLPNPYGAVPVFHFANSVGVGQFGFSELTDVIPLQDAINKTLGDMIVASEFGAYAQRYAIGIEAELDDKGVPLPMPMKAGIDRFLTVSNPDAKFGVLPASDIQPYLSVIDGLIMNVGRVTGIPLHHLLMTGTFPSGEALALATPIPTPAGWTTMGDLESGDPVFDETGATQIVTHAFPVLDGRACYRVTFDDGSALVADAQHKWLTNHYERPSLGTRSPRVRSVVTTEEIARTLHIEISGTGRKRNSTGQAHHFLPLAGAVQFPEARLSLPPYELGAWLGDGDSRDAALTVHEDDLEIAEHLRSEGEKVTIWTGKTRPEIKRVRFGGLDTCRRGHSREYGKPCKACGTLGYQARRDRVAVADVAPPTHVTGYRRLIDLGVMQNKHIPESYMTAAPAQRLALLQGLMDTDGSVTTDGRVTLELHNRRLAEDARRLILSLGHKVALRVGHGRFEGRTVTRYRMAWSAPEPVFRLRRKRERQRTDWGAMTRRRYIVSVEPVESVSVRCIQVTGPSHLFLAGEACIPTHNSQKTAEARLVAKIQDMQVNFGDVWEDALQFALRITGIENARIEAQWQDPQSRAELEHVQSVALKRTQIGISEHEAWRELGFSDDEITAMDTEKAAEQQTATDAFDRAFNKGGAPVVPTVAVTGTLPQVEA